MNVEEQILAGKIEKWCIESDMDWKYSEIKQEFKRWREGCYISFTARLVCKEFKDELIKVLEL